MDQAEKKIGVGAWTVDTSRIAVSSWPQATDVLAGAMIIFLAYEGFELIANTAGDVRDPDHTLPRAYYTSVGFVILLYVMVAVVTVGNLPIAQIVDAANVRLASETGSRRWISMVGMLLCLGALYSLIRYTWQYAPSHIWVLVAMLLVAFAVEGAYRLWRRGSLLLEYLH